jgi:putative membrane protein
MIIMKKKLLFAPLLLCSVLVATAQQDTTRNTQRNQGNKNTKTTNQKAANQKANTTSNQTNSGMNHSGHTDMNQQGQQTNSGGQMTSTGRYAAMGVTSGSLHKKDMKFVMMANSSNTMELQLSQMALQKATNQAVKDFATMMVEHHTMAGQQMKQLLSTKGAMIPDSAILSRHRVRMEMLQNLQGAEFDRAYMRIMVDAHEEDVDEYEDETTDARDADIRAFATKMLPILRTHYTRSKEIRRQL